MYTHVILWAHKAYQLIHVDVCLFLEGPQNGGVSNKRPLKRWVPPKKQTIPKWASFLRDSKPWRIPLGSPEKKKTGGSPYKKPTTGDLWQAQRAAYGARQARQQRVVQALLMTSGSTPLRVGGGGGGGSSRWVCWVTPMDSKK